MRISVNAKMFAAVALAQSVEQTRHYLCGVQIERCERGGVFLVATDGHRMLVGYDAGGVLESDAPVILKAPKAILTAAAKEETAALTFDGETMRCGKVAAIADDIDNGQGASTCGIVVGHFPEWRCVIPNRAAELSNKPLTFNGRYLGDMVKAGKILAPKSANGSVESFHLFAFGDAKGPALVTFGHGLQLFGVLMPAPLVYSHPDPELPFQI